jgi:hypothetical protein
MKATIYLNETNTFTPYKDGDQLRRVYDVS